MPKMPSLPNTRTRRNTACAMLFVWLFALASGLAKESCLKACGDGSQTLLKHASSVDLADPELASFVAAAWAAAWGAEVHVAPAPGRAHDFRLPERGPPIRVLFSRLAL